ncbi:WD40 repeat protein [Allocatelliglobosispora scoriae]|uniref:WD40 repeat protein n=1 Tax=Allocatelliglobosispora scoriae TaxID=643052 RepID=A0A841BTS2_9ACTN|nr:TIR domain-containing protein [Allocatelliglobosispora scoriae]MBB5871095.1 WD40 repeat protein [Allocatelliglobosispora scoriae]
MSGHVFISYSHASDAEYVAALAEFLKAAGVPVWFDGKIVTGARWANVIQERIDSCAAFVVVMSPASAASQWVDREVNQAEETDRPLMPLLLEGKVFFRLNDVQFEDVTRGEMPSPAFVDHLRSLLHMSGVSDPAPVDSGHRRPVNHRAPRPVGSAAFGSFSGGLRKGTRGRLLVAAGVVVVVALTYGVARLNSRTSAAPSSSPSASARTSPAPNLTTFSRTASQRVAPPHGKAEDVLAVALSADGKTMATSSWENRVGVWDVSTPSAPRELTALTEHTGNVFAVAFSTNGKLMATAGSDKRVVLWDMTNPAAPREVGAVTDHTAEVYAVAFSADGKMMATGGWDKRAMVWDVSNPSKPRRLSTLSGHTGDVLAVAFSADGKMLATGSWDHQVMVWDMSSLPSPKRIATLTDHTSGVRAVAFSADGKMMATGGWDNRAMVWDVSNPSTIHRVTTLTEHTRVVLAVAFSADSRTLVTGSWDELVLAWDVSNPSAIHKIATLTDHSRPVYAVAFSADGRTMATGSHGDNLVLMWAVSNG